MECMESLWMLFQVSEVKQLLVSGWSYSDLVIAILCDVSHPRKCLITSLLYDLQVSNLKQ